jgi:hypothetical protein
VSQRGTVEQTLASEEAARPLTAADIRQTIDGIEDKVAMLTDADPQTKAALYASLGLVLTYEPGRRVVTVEAQPCANERVGGTSWTLRPRSRCSRSSRSRSS